MRHRRRSACLFAALLVVSSAAVRGARAGEGGRLAGMTDAHNAARRAAPGAKTPLPPLAWSSKLAAAADDYASKCKATHATPAERGDAGENLFWSTKVGKTKVEEVVGWWAGEVGNYSYPDPIPKCAKGKVCGHYTQVVWRETTEVGCAFRVCEGGGPFGDRDWEIWVCRYAPAGNLAGRPPY